MLGTEPASYGYPFLEVFGGREPFAPVLASRRSPPAARSAAGVVDNSGSRARVGLVREVDSGEGVSL